MNTRMPWSVKGIEPEVRAAAKSAARDAGLTLGQWLNRVILDAGISQTEIDPDADGPGATTAEAKVAQLLQSASNGGPTGSANHQPRTDGSDPILRKRLEALERHQKQTLTHIDQTLNQVSRRLERLESSKTDKTQSSEPSAESSEDDEIGRRLGQIEQDLKSRVARADFESVESALDQIAKHMEASEQRNIDGIRTIESTLLQVADRLNTAGPTVGAGTASTDDVKATIETLGRAFIQQDTNRRQQHADMNDRLSDVAHRIEHLEGATQETLDALRERLFEMSSEIVDLADKLTDIKTDTEEPQAPGSPSPESTDQEPAPRLYDSHRPGMPEDIDGLESQLTALEDQISRAEREDPQSYEPTLDQEEDQAPAEEAEIPWYARRAHEPQTYQDEDADSEAAEANEAQHPQPADLVDTARTVLFEDALRATGDDPEPDDPEPVVPSRSDDEEYDEEDPRRPGIRVLAAVIAIAFLITGGAAAWLYFDGTGSSSDGRPGFSSIIDSITAPFRGDADSRTKSVTPASDTQAAEPSTPTRAIEQPAPARPGVESADDQLEAPFSFAVPGADIASAAPSPETPITEPTAIESSGAQGTTIISSGRDRREQTDAGSLYRAGIRMAANDPAGGALLVRRAAEEGLVEAQFRLATIYESGSGIAQDYDKAYRWYRTAADAGHPKARYNLGVLTAQGRGAPRDYSTAAQLFADAAALGVRDAQYNLGLLEAQGLGANRNPLSAYAWFRQAAARGDEQAEMWKRRLENELSPNGIYVAQNLKFAE